MGWVVPASERVRHNQTHVHGLRALPLQAFDFFVMTRD